MDELACQGRATSGEYGYGETDAQGQCASTVSIYSPKFHRCHMVSMGDSCSLQPNPTSQSTSSWQQNRWTRSQAKKQHSPSLARQPHPPASRAGTCLHRASQKRDLDQRICCHALEDLRSHRSLGGTLCPGRGAVRVPPPNRVAAAGAAATRRPRRSAAGRGKQLQGDAHVPLPSCLQKRPPRWLVAPPAGQSCGRDGVGVGVGERGRGAPPPDLTLPRTADYRDSQMKNEGRTKACVPIS